MQSRTSAIETQQAKLHASDGASFDLFGSAVAVSGNTAVVGAPRNDGSGADAGAAYVFVRSGTSWTQQARLTAADGASNDSFGVSVAISGNTVLVGAESDTDVFSNAGAAYVFVRSGTSWTQQAKLLAADSAPVDHLGVSVALDGNTAVVGTTDDDDAGDRSGAAYVFVRSGTSWSQQGKLTAADGAESDQFGISVAVAGDTAVVGAYGDDDNGLSSGSAYVFTRSGTSWSQQAKLLASDGVAIDEFGISVSVSGDTALIGAVFGDAAYAFVRSGTSWSQQAKLVASDGVDGDDFGNSVALSGNIAVVGAPSDSDLGAASGACYVLVRSGTSWTQQAKLTPSDGASIDFFGNAVALSGDTAVIGAVGDDDLGDSAGAAYAFGPTGANGGTCTTNAECASGFCADGVCCNAACGGSNPNDCQACSIASGAAANGICALRTSGTVCRGSSGTCDAVEQCSGASAACPSDVLAGPTTVCRPAAGSCDLPESCSGSALACPRNRFRPNFSLCSGLLGLPGICLGGVCLL